MLNLIKNRNMIFKLVGFFLLMQGILYANGYEEQSRGNTIPVQSIASLNSQKTQENIEMKLDSFGSIGTIIMIVLTSLIGLFFLRDELDVALE